MLYLQRQLQHNLQRLMTDQGILPFHDILAFSNQRNTEALQHLRAHQHLQKILVFRNELQTIFHQDLSNHQVYHQNQ